MIEFAILMMVLVTLVFVLAPLFEFVGAKTKRLGLDKKRRGIRKESIVLLFFGIGLFVSLEARSEGIKGAVLFGSKGPSPFPIEVQLIELREGMRLDQTGMTDNRGNFVFDTLAREDIPHMIRVSYKGVQYQEVVPPKKTQPSEIVIYDTTVSKNGIRVGMVNILAMVEDRALRLEKTYFVENALSDPKTYVNEEEGTFRFFASPGAAPEVSVYRGKIPISQAARKGKEEGEFIIAYPLKPGVTEVTVAYEMDYSNRKTLWEEVFFDHCERVNFGVVPTDVKVKSSTLKKVELEGTHEGVSLYTAGPVFPGSKLAAILEGGQPVEAGRKRIMGVAPQIYHYKWMFFALVLLFLSVIATLAWRMRKKG